MDKVGLRSSGEEPITIETEAGDHFSVSDNSNTAQESPASERIVRGRSGEKSSISSYTDQDVREGTGTLGAPASTINVTVGDRGTVGKQIFRPRSGFSVYQVVDFVFWICSALLTLRFLFKLLGANQENQFVSFIYSGSEWLVKPFTGIVSEMKFSSTGVLELSTLITWLVVWLVYMILRRAVRIVVPKG